MPLLLDAPNLGEREKEMLLQCVDSTYVSTAGPFVPHACDQAVSREMPSRDGPRQHGQSAAPHIDAMPKTIVTTRQPPHRDPYVFLMMPKLHLRYRIVGS